MVYKYIGKSYHRDLVLWKYYIRLAVKSRSIERATYWTRLAQKAMQRSKS